MNNPREKARLKDRAFFAPKKALTTPEIDL